MQEWWKNFNRVELDYVIKINLQKIQVMKMGKDDEVNIQLEENKLKQVRSFK